MTPFKRFALTACTLIALAAPASASQPLSESEIAGLQAAVQNHIDQVSVDGAYLSLDPKTMAVRQLYPAKAHPTIMSVGEYFVLCADFRNEAGKNEEINFFVARNGSRYVVFASGPSADEEMHEMMEKEGTAKAN